MRIQSKLQNVGARAGDATFLEAAELPLVADFARAFAAVGGGRLPRWDPRDASSGTRRYVGPFCAVWGDSSTGVR